MRRTRALMMYLVVPCLLYAAAFVVVVARFPAIVETSTLRQSYTVFVAITAIVLFVKRNGLSAGR